jgi:hypothetical protein
MVLAVNTKDPEVRRIIIDQYNRRGAQWVENEYGVTRRKVARWKKLLADTGTLSPRFHERGRNVELAPREIKKLENALLDDPFLTNAELAAKVGNKITPRSAGNYIANSPLEFKMKFESPDVEASFSRETAQQCKQFMTEVENIPIAKRYYVDETWISAAVRRRRGRFAKGRSTAVPRNRKYSRHTVIAAIHNHAWLHPSKIYKKGSITTGEVENYVRYSLAPKLKKGDVVIWDRLGRSGRAKNPKALHFSPKSKQYITNRGARLVMLPPTGKLFDPIEPVFGDTKRIYDKLMGGQVLPSKVTFEEKVKMWHKAERKVSHDSFKRAYHERANGQEFVREYKKRRLL